MILHGILSQILLIMLHHWLLLRHLSLSKKQFFTLIFTFINNFVKGFSLYNIVFTPHLHLKLINLPIMFLMRLMHRLFFLFLLLLLIINDWRQFDLLRLLLLHIQILLALFLFFFRWFIMFLHRWRF